MKVGLRQAGIGRQQVDLTNAYCIDQFARQHEAEQLKKLKAEVSYALQNI